MNKLNRMKSIFQKENTISSFQTAPNISHDNVLQRKAKKMLIGLKSKQFEVEADIEKFGSQKVLCGGGRYNGLVEGIGGPKISGVGFALGLERLLNALEAEEIDLNEDNGIDIYVAPMSEKEESYSLGLTQSLRLSGFNVEMDYMNRKLQNNFKQADKLNAKFIIILGEDEVNTNILTIKNNKTKEEFKVSTDDVIEFFDNNIEEEHHE